MERCREVLESGLTELSLAQEPCKVAPLLAFVELIAKWNKTYNLTAVRDREAMVRLHLLDSLAILPWVEGRRVIDLGTGAGLPGIPLAICRPDIEFTLLDSNAKKTRFVQQAALELKLNNVRICRQRAEHYSPEALFDGAICRALADLQDSIDLSRHLLMPGGVLLAMKGQAPKAELERLSVKSSVIALRIPGIDAERCLVRIEAF